MQEWGKLKILVTGATGFIGNKVVQELLLQDVDVITCSRSVANLQQYGWYGRTQHITHDILSKTSEDLYRKFLLPDRIIHLAWADLQDYFAKSHMGFQLTAHKKFLSNLIINGATHIVGAGTCFEYGLAEGQVKEGSQTVPVTPYGQAKLELQQFLELLQSEFSFTYQWLRYFYIYGEGQNGRSLIPSLKKAIASGKKTLICQMESRFVTFFLLKELPNTLLLWQCRTM